jgi:hypothetical protein
VFEDLPAEGEIGVAFGQGPDAMQMVREKDDGLLAEGIFIAGFREGAVQGVPGRSAGQERPAMVGDQREKEGSTRVEDANVIGYGG